MHKNQKQLRFAQFQRNLLPNMLKHVSFIQIENTTSLPTQILAAFFEISKLEDQKKCEKNEHKPHLKYYLKNTSFLLLKIALKLHKI